jgi:hypothetical protein
VGSKLQRHPAEKQSNLDLQLQPDFQQDNACSSPTPPSQQFGGDDYLSDLGTPQTVVKKENEVFKCKMEVDRIAPVITSTGTTSDFPQNEDSLENMSLVCSASAEFVQGQGKPNLRTVRSSNNISREGQGKQNLRTVRSSNSISTEDKVHELLVSLSICALPAPLLFLRSVSAEW